jgi:protein O-GlcNAc transferase
VKQRRNDLCSCGSGKKYKHCCEKKIISLTRTPPAEINQLVSLYSAGRYSELEDRMRPLLRQYPDFGFGWKLLGNALRIQGKNALPAFQRAVELMPDEAESHYNLGVAQNILGLLTEADASYRRALNIKPDFIEAQNKLSLILKGAGKEGSSQGKHASKAALDAGMAEAHFRKAVTLHDLGQYADAVASYRRVLDFKPDSAEVYFNIGTALECLEKPDEAIESYRHALEIEPELAEAHNNLANILRHLGRLDEAEASYRRVLEIEPARSVACVAYSNLLYTYAFTRHISPESELRLASKWENTALSENERAVARNRALSFDNPPRGGRKLKIGVVSAELGQHPVAYFLEPFLEQLDRGRFHATLYPTAIRQESRAARFKKLADEYKPLVGIPDSAAADLIRSDRIDILVDTTGHMTGCRLGIFAHRAAPVQCHYIGYHGSTGLTEMDWFIADADLLPPAYDAHFRERIWRLPRLRIAYKGDIFSPGSNWKPDPEGTVWLGSFNNLTKVREETLGLWAKVMNALPQSRLFLKDRQAINANVQKRIVTELLRHGINSGRIEFAGDVPDYAAHMALYDRLDIALDTTPLNGETTAFDALWMGVPLVTIDGNWYGARMTGAMLRAMGKPEWVAKNADEFVAIVAALALDVEKRISLRASQRAMMEKSTLCDAEGLARSLEEAFEAMFDQWIERKNTMPDGNLLAGAHKG